MVQTDKLAKMLSDVALNGSIEECVLNVKDGVASIQAIDMTSSIFVQTNTELPIDDSQIGIGDLALLVRCMVMLKGEPTKIELDDNRIAMAPKKGTKVSYLLTEADLITTYDEEFAETGDVIKNELKSYDKGIPLTENTISRLIDSMNLFNHNSVIFNGTKKGKVSAHSGNDNEHQIDVSIGKSSSGEEFSVKIYAKHLNAVLSSIDFTQNPELFLKEGASLIVQTDTSSWMLEPILSEE